MKRPILHPTDFRFHLSKIGIDLSDESLVASGYICLRFMQHIVERNGWRYHFSAYKNEKNYNLLFKLFPEVVNAIDQRIDCSDSSDFWREFGNVCNVASRYSFEKFIRNICPNFVTNPDECISLLKLKEFGEGAHSVDISHCLHVGFAVRYRYAESLEQAYASYQDVFNQAGLVPLSKENFQALFAAVNCYSLSSSAVTRTSSSAAFAISLFRSKSIDLGYQIDLYALIRKTITKNVDNPFQHIKSSTHSFMFDLLGGIENTVNQAASVLRKVSPSDFLETLTTEVSRRKRGAITDAATECGFIYHQFKNYLSAINAKKVFIIYPSIPFIRQWVQEESLNNVETYFFMWQDSSAAILADEFAHHKNCFFFSESSSYLLESCDAHLLFYRNYVDANLLNLAATIAPAYSDNIFCLFPDELVKTLVSELSDPPTYWPSVPCIESIDILPTDIFTSEPKRKAFLKLRKSKEGVVSPGIDMTTYYLVKDPSLENILLPAEKTIQTSLDTLNGTDSIRTVYRNEGAASCLERQRKLPTPYVFSPELTIWYTLNHPKEQHILTPKVKAYLCEYPDKKKLKYGTLKRGKEIKSAHIWKTNFPEESIRSWIEYTAVFAPQMHSEAVKLIREQYKRDPISLKTFWYLHQDYALPLDSPRNIAIHSFIHSADIAQLKVGLSTKEDYVGAVNHYFDYYLAGEENDVRDECIHYVWDFLCDLLDTAVDESYYKINPVEELCSRVRSRHDEFHEIREALTKKTFTLEEEKAFLSFVLNDDTPLALGAMIRLFTGMPPTQVCALRFRDFEILPYTGNYYQLLVYKKITKAGSAPTPLKRPEEYRRIPVAPLLSEYIYKYIQRLEKRLGIKIKDTEYYMISEIVADSKPTQAPRPLAPSTLQKYCKKAISSLGIEHVPLQIPDDTGTKESDFSQYQADIFRSNLRYRLKNVCGFTNSECDYVLGVQLKNTFAKHYCDYTNIFSQMTMLAKFSWWCALLQSTDVCPQKKKLSLRNRHLTVNPTGSGCATAEISLSVIPVEADTNAEVAFRIRSDHGYDGLIDVLKEVDYE